MWGILSERMNSRGLSFCSNAVARCAEPCTTEDLFVLVDGHAKGAIAAKEGHSPAPLILAHTTRSYAFGRFRLQKD